MGSAQGCGIRFTLLCIAQELRFISRDDALHGVRRHGVWRHA